MPEPDSPAGQEVPARPMWTKTRVAPTRSSAVGAMWSVFDARSTDALRRRDDAYPGDAGCDDRLRRRPARPAPLTIPNPAVFDAAEGVRVWRCGPGRQRQRKDRVLQSAVGRGGGNARAGSGYVCRDGKHGAMPKGMGAACCSSPNSPDMRLSFWISYAPRIRNVLLSVWRLRASLDLRSPALPSAQAAFLAGGLRRADEAERRRMQGACHLAGARLPATRSQSAGRARGGLVRASALSPRKTFQACNARSVLTRLPAPGRGVA